MKPSNNSAFSFTKINGLCQALKLSLLMVCAIIVLLRPLNKNIFSPTTIITPLELYCHSILVQKMSFHYNIDFQQIMINVINRNYFISCS